MPRMLKDYSYNLFPLRKTVVKTNVLSLYTSEFL